MKIVLLHFDTHGLQISDETTSYNIILRLRNLFAPEGCQIDSCVLILFMSVATGKIAHLEKIKVLIEFNRLVTNASHRD